MSRGIRIAVYLITAVLATASALIGLIDIDESKKKIVPVRFNNIYDSCLYIHYYIKIYLKIIFIL